MSPDVESPPQYCEVASNPGHTLRHSSSLVLQSNDQQATSREGRRLSLDDSMMRYGAGKSETMQADEDHEQSGEETIPTLYGAKLQTGVPSPALPADVLCLLYEIVSVMERPTPKHLGWIRLTHVNRSWRSVGMDLALLWARDYGTMASHDATAAFRMRARGMPLTVRIPEQLDRHHEDVLIHAVSGSIRAIETLSLTANSYMWSSLIAGKRLPDLRMLYIDDSTPRADSYYKLSQPLHAPRLEHATLKGCRPFLLIAPSLRSLTLMDMRMRGVHILDLLQGTPSLEHLVIHVPIMLESHRALLEDEQVRRHPPVQLSHLRSLNMDFGLEDGLRATYLSRLVIPKETKDKFLSQI